MCGRYTYLFTWEEIYTLLNLQWPAAAELRPSYNVAPAQQAPIVRSYPERGRGLEMAKWGLVPSWAQDPSLGARMINARAESVAEKPAFRTAFRRSRCVVPVSGFYEWQAREGKEPKQPWYIHRADGQPLCFAGLTELWQGAEQPITSFTIITTTANEFMTPVHHRMPVILEPEQVEAWLDPETPAAALAGMLRPAADGVLDMYAVSRRVNSPRNNDAECVRPEGVDGG